MPVPLRTKVNYTRRAFEVFCALRLRSHQRYDRDCVVWGLGRYLSGVEVEDSDKEVYRKVSRFLRKHKALAEEGDRRRKNKGRPKKQAVP